MCIYVMCEAVGFGEIGDCSCFGQEGDGETPPVPPPGPMSFGELLGMSDLEVVDEVSAQLGVGTDEPIIGPSANPDAMQGTWPPQP